MGLDMYLTKKTYIGAKYEHQNVKGVISLTQGKDNKPIPIQLNRISEIIEDIGYWRKANQIHKWFVDNVQEGVDNCADYYVSEEKLKQLLELCRQVKANSKLADKVLPTGGGFFFGSTEYDDYYMQDIDDTIKILEIATKEEGDYYYSSSW